MITWPAQAGASRAALITLDVQTLETQRHALVRRPQCPRCGNGSYRPDRKPHLDPRIGLLRALTELNQILPAVSRVDRDGNGAYQLDDPNRERWLQTATLANQPHLAPDDGPPRARADYDLTWSDDLCVDVLRCQAIVERQGVEMLVLDQTRPDIGLPVVKVFVPGLRHFWARFAPGRLYDVPTELGWLDRPLGEDELNPIPMFL